MQFSVGAISVCPSEVEQCDCNSSFYNRAPSFVPVLLPQLAPQLFRSINRNSCHRSIISRNLIPVPTLVVFCLWSDAADGSEATISRDLAVLSVHHGHGSRET